jgi:ATP-dependent Clp protease ATP-binding subunit ClpC
LQPERVKHTAHGQGIELNTDESVIDHLAAVGFRPEFRARELKRLIRSELKTHLSRAMLHEGDRVLFRWDLAQQKIVFELKTVTPATRQDDSATAADAVEEADRESFLASDHPPGTGSSG